LPKSIKGIALPEPHSGIDPTPYLRDNERIVSQFGPYLATSQRVLLVIERRGKTESHEIPYPQLESIDDVRVLNHQKMARGALLALTGFLVSLTWLSIISLAIVVVGIVLLIRGAVKKVTYYQLRGRGMEGPELYKWQLQHFGAGSFIASIQTITGRRRPE
jgi:hypothetical protein